MDSPNPSSMRVLTRPPNLTPTQPTLPPPIPPNQTDHQSPPPSSGVIVVGFIGRRNTDVTQLINRVVDANVYGSGKLDKDLGFQKGDGDWFKCRRISYYDDDENGIVYLQFSSTVCPAMEEVYDSCSSSSGFDSVLEEREFGDLQGMLFMFSHFGDKLRNFNGKNYWTSRKKPFTCLTFHLQKVKFIGFGHYKVGYNLSFLRFLLKNARVLQKMVINAQMVGCNRQKEFSRAAQKLLSFPRSSPNAVVLCYE